MNCLWEFLISSSASNLGSSIGGISTLVALIFAWRQVDAWKKQHQNIKESEAAAKAIIGCSRLQNVVNELSSDYLLHLCTVPRHVNPSLLVEGENTIEDGFKGEPFFTHYNSVLTSNKSSIDAFYQGQIEADIYLKEDLREKIRKSAEVLDELKFELAQIYFCLNYDRESLEQKKRIVFATESKKRRSQIITKSIETLKETANFK